MKINFYKQRFYLESEAYSRGAHTVHVSPEKKKSLRYQILILSDYKTKESKIYSLSGVRSINVLSEFDEAWVICKTKTVHDEPCVYSEKEIFVIKSFISFFADKSPSLCEALCESLGSNVLSLYHSVYGSIGLKNFKKALPGLECIRGKSERKIYDRPRYSVESLVRDLYTSRDTMIYMDPELVGKYNRISVKKESRSEAIKDEWHKLVKISGNRTRANINLTVNSQVNVVVPENEYGVEPGIRKLHALRSFSVVTDGMLNIEDIGIKTKNKKLIGKLKRLGILNPMLFQDEYLVDLTKLPVATKKPMPGILQLALAEYMIKRIDVTLAYLGCLIYMKEKKVSTLPLKKLEDLPEKDKATQYLESLGIYGNYFYPNKQEAKPSKSYKTVEVVGKISGIPSNIYPSVRNFINNGSCKNQAVLSILKDLEPLALESLDKIREELKYYQMDRNARIIYLRDLKFRAIMGKTLKFAGKGSMETRAEHLEMYNVSVYWKLYETNVLV